MPEKSFIHKSLTLYTLLQSGEGGGDKKLQCEKYANTVLQSIILLAKLRLEIDACTVLSKHIFYFCCVIYNQHLEPSYTPLYKYSPFLTNFQKATHYW
jgi:hypothetical protein